MSNVLLDEQKNLKTILDYLRYAVTEAKKADVYYGHGTDNVFDDMRSLILGSLSLPFDLPETWYASRLTTDERVLLLSQIKKRLHDHIPVPYLINEAYFCGLPFYVDERVLIPRSPIGELILNQVAPWVAPEAVQHILDLCTGSGCIAIASAYAFPEADVDAVDISLEALNVAEKNIKRHHLEASVHLIQSDCFDSIPKKQYDIILSNPPYVSYDEMATLPQEYMHEPKLALEADDNGLAIVEKILSQANAYLSPQGVLVVEVGNSETALIEAYPDVPFTWLDFERGGQGVFLLTKAQLDTYFKRELH
jgi:ribosomal protein L3 glutamine methyltransferase